MGALGIEEGAFDAAAAEPGTYDVWAENADALALFLACQTQWRVTALSSPGGGVMVFRGLDYPAAAIAAEGLDLRLSGRVFEDLRVMEAAALGELNRR